MFQSMQNFRLITHMHFLQTINETFLGVGGGGKGGHGFHFALRQN